VAGKRTEGTQTLNRTAAVRKARLIRGIGFIGGVLLVLNGMIGAGIFALPSAVAANAGLLSPWLFLAAGVLIITVVLTLAELSSYFEISGGPALYAARAFGPLTGFCTGWLYFVSRAAAVAANCHVIAIYLGAISPWFDTETGHAVVVIVFIGSLTLINVLGIKSGIRALTFFTFFKLTPLLVMIALGLQFVTPDILFPDNLPTINDLGGTTLLLMYAFVGCEQVLVPAGETSKPRETIPKALIFTVIVTGIFYFLIVLVYVSVLSDDFSGGATLVDVAHRLTGPVGAIVISVTAVFSIGGNLSGIMLAIPRLTLSLADDRLLPKWFGHINERFSSPTNSIIFLGGVSATLALSGSFVYLATAVSLTRLIVYVVCIVALPVIKRQADRAVTEQAYRLIGGYTFPLIALGLCLWMISLSSADSWRLTGILLVAGLVLYWLEQSGIKRGKAIRN